MDFNVLNDLLKRANQRFICSAAGNASTSKFVAHITHEVTAPIDGAMLKKLKGKTGYHNQLMTFYSSYGSVRLYCDTISDDSAYYLAHPSEWDELQNEFNLWLEDLDEEEQKEVLPDWLNDAIVIGEIPSSGNYYLFVTKGRSQGKVFEFEHDGFEFIEVGEDLSSFIDSICNVTEALMRDISSHTRYSDGETDIQWLAKNYEYDGSVR